MDENQERELKVAVGNRLRAVAIVFDLIDGGRVGMARALGDVCDGANASQVSNWINGYYFPPVPNLNALCDQTGVTLDWILRGALGAMEPKLARRLNKIVSSLPTKSA